MINRIQDVAEENGKHMIATAKEALSQSGRTLKNALTQLEETIAKNPAASLVAAFAVGVTVAWWLKRR
jgi:hypothetical protein